MPKTPQTADDVTVRIGRSRPMGINPGSHNLFAASVSPAGATNSHAGDSGVAVEQITGAPAPSSGLTLNGVTKEEIALAASSTSPDPAGARQQIAARRKVAQAFYEQKSKFDRVTIKQHLTFIDFSKPLEARVTPPPYGGIRWQAPGGRQGNYYGNPGSMPSELGIGSLGLAPGPLPQRIVAKIPVSYNIASGTPVLESRAAKAIDTWSVDSKAGLPGTMGSLGMQQRAKGGGIQYFIPDKAAAKS